MDYHWAVHPPSMDSDAPVTCLASSEQRYATMAPIYGGSGRMYKYHILLWANFTYMYLSCWLGGNWDYAVSIIICD